MSKSCREIHGVGSWRRIGGVAPRTSRPAKFSPSVSKANAVGVSVVPTNGRPYFSGDMGNTLSRVETVTVPSKRENPGSTPGLDFSHGVGRETGTSPVVNVCRDHKKTQGRALF